MSEDNKPLELPPETTTEQVTAPAAPEKELSPEEQLKSLTGPRTVASEIKRRRLMKQIRQRASVQKQYKKLMAQWQKKQANQESQYDTELKRLAKQVGNDNFLVLKDVCTLRSPEKKNEAGEVVEPAQSYLNKEALIRELKHLVILQRQGRVDSGKRKKTTGRSSRRRVHRESINFLRARDAEATKEENAYRTVVVGEENKTN